MKPPKQKPHRSKQDYGTPREFIRAVEVEFGALQWDLAASTENRKAFRYFTEAQDSLMQEWALGCNGLLWLNPPFSRIAPWAQKCSVEASRGAEILMLVPASVGSNWYRDYVHPFAKVLALSPRLTFEGCADPYPKDLILCCYGFGETGLEPWQWK